MAAHAQNQTLRVVAFSHDDRLWDVATGPVRRIRKPRFLNITAMVAVIKRRGVTRHDKLTPLTT